MDEIRVNILSDDKINIDRQIARWVHKEVIYNIVENNWLTLTQTMKAWFIFNSGCYETDHDNDDDCG